MIALLAKATFFRFPFVYLGYSQFLFLLVGLFIVDIKAGIEIVITG